MGGDYWRDLVLRGVFCRAGSGLLGFWTVRVMAHAVIIIEGGLVVVVLRFGLGCACGGSSYFMVQVVCSYFVFQVSCIKCCVSCPWVACF